jgi:hypothetical protein
LPVIFQPSKKARAQSSSGLFPVAEEYLNLMIHTKLILLLMVVDIIPKAIRDLEILLLYSHARFHGLFPFHRFLNYPVHLVYIYPLLTDQIIVAH